MAFSGIVCYDVFTTSPVVLLPGAGPLRGPLLFGETNDMAKGPYRTIVYVDGFNFYYGEVRGTP